jgi:hypothetical protein
MDENFEKGPIIITPERFLERAQVTEIRSLVFLIFKKLQIELDPTAATAPHYLGTHSPNLYTLAFNSPESAQRTDKEIFARLDKILPDQLPEFTPDDKFRSLPPLFLLSCTKFIIFYDDLILIAQSDGPIIPVVSLKAVREKSNEIMTQLKTVYELASSEFMNIDKLNGLLSPHQSSSPKNQKKTQWTPP